MEAHEKTTSPGDDVVKGSSPIPFDPGDKLSDVSVDKNGSEKTEATVPDATVQREDTETINTKENKECNPQTDSESQEGLKETSTDEDTNGKKDVIGEEEPEKAGETPRDKADLAPDSPSASKHSSQDEGEKIVDAPVVEASKEEDAVTDETEVPLVNEKHESKDDEVKKGDEESMDVTTEDNSSLANAVQGGEKSSDPSSDKEEKVNSDSEKSPGTDKGTEASTKDTQIQKTVDGVDEEAPAQSPTQTSTNDTVQSNSEEKVKDPDVQDGDSNSASDAAITVDEEKGTVDDKGTANKATKSETKTSSKVPKACIVCKKVSKCKYNIVRNGDVKHLCDDTCFKAFRGNPTKYLRSEEADKAKSTPKESDRRIDKSKEQCCATCSKVFTLSTISRFEVKNGDIKPFCTEKCHQDNKTGKKICGFCRTNVRDSTEAILASIYDGNYLRDFCNKQCHEKFEQENKGIKIQDSEETDVVEIQDDNDVDSTTTVSNVTQSGPKSTSISSVTNTHKPDKRKPAPCSVCHKILEVKHEIEFDGKHFSLCGDTCFSAFRYANKLAMNECSSCGAHCSNDSANPHTIQFEGQTKKFCSMGCINNFKVKKSRTVPCTWCQAKKTNFEMIERVDAHNKYQLFCSLNCLSLYRVNLQATSNQSVHCDQCKRVAPAQYHLTMSDASVRNFCQYNCVMAFQAQFTAPNKNTAAPTGGKSSNKAAPPALPPSTPGTRQSPRQAPKSRQGTVSSMVQKPTVGPPTVPVISNVMSLAGNDGSAGRGKGAALQNNTTPGTPQTASVGSQIIIQPPPPKSVKNKSLLCKPFTQTKATACRPHTQTKECQTDESHQTKPVLIPVPIPIYVPVPMAMYNVPQPYPLPIPIPVPIPFFVPTTKKNADSILKHIKEIQERMPADPFEAELLMMAEAVASADKSDSSDESDEDGGSAPEPTFDPSLPMAPSTPPGVNAANDMGEDMLSMALRMAEMPPADDGHLDLEDSIQSTPISQPPAQPSHEVSVTEPEFSTIDQNNEILSATRGRGGWRGKRSRRGRGGSAASARTKKARVDPPQEEQIMSPTPVLPPPPSDANMVLKYSFGVNAWKHWVVQKNAQLEKASTGGGRLKLFKTDILQCTSDELNYSLCLFVKEVRKPNGEEYAPDSIYYLCLGIQQYLFENGRIDNIFTDFYYEKFTECLNEILQRYEVRLNRLGLIVCRIEEEHLWESKQLGAHSPHVLLNTLVYFNTKSFMLRTAEEHIRLSFSHIMKHWKKTNTPGTRTPGRSVYLRYYAPVSAKENSSKRKREEVPVYEQAENVENPLKCPVKLYEFYLSKCPESIRNRNDVFYLVPERSCVPDSPVWYSTASLGIDAMTKMLNRVRVVREIQMSHIHHTPMFSS